MDITKLTKKPQLIKLTLDSAEIVENYGEPINFWMMDSLSLNTYFNFYRLQQQEDDKLLYSLLRSIVLNEEGKQAIADDEIIPTDVTIGIIMKVSEHLGKSSAKMSTQETGTTQK